MWNTYLDSDLLDAIDSVDFTTLQKIQECGTDCGSKDLFDDAMTQVAASADVAAAFNEFLQSDVVRNAGGQHGERSPPSSAGAMRDDGR